MKVTFIRPSITGTRAFDAMEPLVFAVLSALTPERIDRELFDERVEPIPDDFETDLVALTVETYTARRAYQIAAGARARGIPVVMGGYHPSLALDEALRHADAVVVGDAEGVWAEVLADASQGALRRVYRQSGYPSLETLRFDREIFRGKRYAGVAPVQFGRGCRFACDFCSIHAFYGSSVRARPAREVAAEVEALGRKTILLVDDNLFVDLPRAEELFRELAPLKVRWGCQVSIDVAWNTPLLDLMARSGCVGALVGFESLDDTNLVQMRKRWNLKGGPYAEAIRRFRERGIMIYGSFVFGYDNDATDVFDATADFALESKLFLVNFSALTPTPGTRLIDRLRDERRLLRDPWWLDPDYRYGEATFRPARMSTDELTEGCLRARSRFYGYGSIARRALETRANCRGPLRLGIYLAANLLSRRELSRKLGQPLGAHVPMEAAAP